MNKKIDALQQLFISLSPLEDLDMWPETGIDIMDIFDELKYSFSENLIETNKFILTKKLYLNNEPDIFYMRELDRVLNVLNGIIFRIKTKLKNYSDVEVEIHGRWYSVYLYFGILTFRFESFYNLAKDRIQEVEKLQKKKSKKNLPEPQPIIHPFKDEKTFALFNYIVNNWNYKRDIKWAYIYNFFDNPNIYLNEYERYVKRTQNFEGLFKYHNANSQKVYDALKNLKESFINNYQ